MYDRFCLEWEPLDRIEFFFLNKYGKKRNPYKSPLGMEATVSQFSSEEDAVHNAYYELYHDDWSCDRINQETLYHNPDYCCAYCAVENQNHSSAYYARW